MSFHIAFRDLDVKNDTLALVSNPIRSARQILARQPETYGMPRHHFERRFGKPFQPSGLAFASAP
jgi:hypothetical protein